MGNKVFVIFVTYHPQIQLLNNSINSIINQVEKIIIVDNTPLGCKELETLSNEKVEIIYLKENMGIAYAQNVGIERALESGADFIITSDQDTSYPDNYVQDMLYLYKKYAKYYKIAAIAPFFRDVNANNELMPIMIYENGKIRKLRKFKEPLEEIYFVSHTISSGMFISKEAILNVGYMDSKLFIDWVDTEWCFRANIKGYKILQTPKIIIAHRHGESAKKLFRFVLTKHNSIRRYYRVRNGIYLLLYNKNINWSMRKYIIESLMKMFIMHFFQAENKIEEIKNKYYAIIDGLRKNLGALKRQLK